MWYFCLLCTLCFSSSAVDLLCGKRKTSEFSGPRILQSFPQEGPEPQINTSTWPSVRVPERAVSALSVTYRIPWDVSRLLFLQCGFSYMGLPFCPIPWEFYLPRAVVYKTWPRGCGVPGKFRSHLPSWMTTTASYTTEKSCGAPSWSAKGGSRRWRGS